MNTYMIILTVGTAKLFSIYVYLKCFLEDISDTIQPEIEDQSNLDDIDYPEDKMIVDTHEKPVEEETKEDAPEKDQHAFEYVDYDYADEPVEKQMTSTSGDSAVDANISLGKESRVQPPQAKTSLNDSSSNEEEPSKATTPEPTNEPTPEPTPEEVEEQKGEKFLKHQVEISFGGQDLTTTFEEFLVGLLAFELAKKCAYLNDWEKSQVNAKPVDIFLSGLKQDLANLKENGHKNHFQSLANYPKYNPGLDVIREVLKEFPHLFERICDKLGGKLQNLEDKNNDKHEVLEEVFDALWDNKPPTSHTAQDAHETMRKKFIAYIALIINADSAELIEDETKFRIRIWGRNLTLPITDSDKNSRTHTHYNFFDYTVSRALARGLEEFK